eukprot:Nitzschia sp. Nitz4//scaffold62_size106224//40262//42097//NITZ4_004352-RA/size106224-processed-gene-0.52-mRNA-1//-1//CDS//3329555844//4300//frame0
MAPDESKSEEPEEPQSSEESSSAEVTATFTLASPVPIQEKLQDAISDLSIRTQVQDCLHSMLVDVETTIYLQQQLELQANRQTLHSLHKQHQATILEADAERLARDSNRAEMADSMVREMMTLSQELESLLHWKQENLQKVQDYDDLLAKLAQTEEELQAAQRAQFSGQPKPRVPESNTTDTATTELESQETTQPKDSSPVLAPLVQDDTLVSSSALDTKPPAVSLDDDAPLETTTAAEDTQTTQSEPVDSDAVLASTEPTETAAAAAAEVVALDEDEKEDAPPTLLSLDVEILMTIFGFMDAMDILNMAQINLEMYAKVDNIFGISEDGQSPPQPPAPAPAPAPVAVAAAAPKPAGPTPASAPAPAKSTPTASPSMGPLQAPTGPLGGRLLSMIQPARAGGKKPAPGINSTVAQAASKLSDAEVAAILAMTNRLTKAEKEVEQLRSEKETLLAKLDGTEAVKQFLINKVRDVELKLTLSRDDEIKVTNQIASDQEVIAFLDSRVQILERQTENLTKEKSRAMSELESTTVQTSKKITMLSDMLKYEREKLKEEEGEWKATKKVLVKEVKSCRAQILALQAERDGLKEQNEMMKRAMLSTGRSPTGVTSPR